MVGHLSKATKPERGRATVQTQSCFYCPCCATHSGAWHLPTVKQVRNLGEGGRLILSTTQRPPVPRNLKSAPSCARVMPKTDSLGKPLAMWRVYDAPASLTHPHALPGGGRHLPSREASAGREGAGCLFSYRLLTLRRRACPCPMPPACGIALCRNRKSMIRSKVTAKRGIQGLQPHGHLPLPVPLWDPTDHEHLALGKRPRLGWGPRGV